MRRLLKRSSSIFRLNFGLCSIPKQKISLDENSFVQIFHSIVSCTLKSIWEGWKHLTKIYLHGWSIKITMIMFRFLLGWIGWCRLIFSVLTFFMFPFELSIEKNSIFINSNIHRLKSIKWKIGFSRLNLTHTWSIFFSIELWKNIFSIRMARFSFFTCSVCHVHQISI